jgi:hypothetical protein
METEEMLPPIVEDPSHGPTRRRLLCLKSAFVNWLFADIKVATLRLGQHSVTIGDRITYNDDQTPTAAGQLGMNTTNGRPRAYIGGQSRELPGDHEVLRPDGEVANAADQDWGGFRLTNLGLASLAADAPTWGQVIDLVTTRVDALEWSDGVDAATTTAIAADATLAGETLTANANGAFATVDGVAPAMGNFYLLKDEANAKDGVWTLTTLGDGSTAWVLTRRTDFAVGQGVAGRLLPVKRGTVYGGTDWRVSSAAGSDVVGTHTITFSVRTVTNDHGSLVGLGDDDHSIYALLAGRSGGQTFVGGSGAGQSLTLSSTSHATKGLIDLLDAVQVGGNIGLNGDFDIKPTTSGQGRVGTVGKKFAQVNAVVVNMGDAVMQSPEDPSARFVFIEAAPDHLIVVNPVTGRAWDVLSAGASRSATPAEIQRAVDGPGGGA